MKKSTSNKKEQSSQQEELRQRVSLLEKEIAFLKEHGLSVDEQNIVLEEELTPKSGNSVSILNISLLIVLIAALGFQAYMLTMKNSENEESVSVSAESISNFEGPLQEQKEKLDVLTNDFELLNNRITEIDNHIKNERNSKKSENANFSLRPQIENNQEIKEQIGKESQENQEALNSKSEANEAGKTSKILGIERSTSESDPFLLPL